MLTGIYRPVWVPTVSRDETLTALAFVVNRSHPQYTGALSVDAQAHLVARAQGVLGSNIDYLENTLSALDSAGMVEPELASVLKLARRHRQHVPR